MIRDYYDVHYSEIQLKSARKFYDPDLAKDAADAYNQEVGYFTYKMFKVEDWYNDMWVLEIYDEYDIFVGYL